MRRPPPQNRMSGGRRSGPRGFKSLDPGYPVSLELVCVPSLRELVQLMPGYPFPMGRTTRVHVPEGGHGQGVCRAECTCMGINMAIF